MENKSQLLAMLREELSRWEKVVGRLSQAQVLVPLTPSTFSVKDTLAHLMAWQQVSIARLDAAHLGKEPVFPDWTGGSNPDDAQADVLNAWIQEAHRHQSWTRVHQSWRDGFFSFLELAEQISGADFADPRKHPWLSGYPLLSVLQGSYEHHHIDHLEPLLQWLRENGVR